MCTLGHATHILIFIFPRAALPAPIFSRAIFTPPRIYSSRSKYYYFAVKKFAHLTRTVEQERDVLIPTSVYKLLVSSLTICYDTPEYRQASTLGIARTIPERRYGIPQSARRVKLHLSTPPSVCLPAKIGYPYARSTSLKWWKENQLII